MRNAAFPFVVSLILVVLPPLCAQHTDQDTDGDGLSDFHEIHKYKTDPKKRDSDGDGVPDGDWNERREWTYSIRSVIQVMPPVNRAALVDDYQDGRVLDVVGDEYVEIEVVHYPLNSVDRAIGASSKWRSPPDELRRYLEPRPAANFDPKMRSDLLAALKKDGIDPARLTDADAARKVTAWALVRAKRSQLFATYCVHFPKGKPAVRPGCESLFNRSRKDATWTDGDIFQRDILGRGMFYAKTRGNCTSTATYLTTVLRAIGLPTRQVLCIPVVDASDPHQLRLVRDRITHHAVRRTIRRGVKRLGQAFASHTFNEVWVDGRWRRLNYTNLGQNILDEAYFGLLTHVNTFDDLSDAGLSRTWGTRYAQGYKSAAFRGSNPYSALTLSDRFGTHAKIANPKVEDVDATELSVTLAYWFQSSHRPSTIPADAVENDGSGHVLMHVDFDGSFSEMTELYWQVDKSFTLTATGQPTLRANAELGCWGNEFYLRIPKSEMARMKSGVAYRIVPRNERKAGKWKMAKDVRLERGKGVVTSTPKSHTSMTIEKAYWGTDHDAPAIVRQNLPKDGHGHFFIHVKEWNPLRGGDQLKEFSRAVDREFDLVADGRTKVLATCSIGSVASSSGHLREFHLIVLEPHLAKLIPGVAYTLAPRNKKPTHQWKVAKGVRVIRPE